MHTVGIDLGTTFSSVGIFENGKVTIINNDDSIVNPKTTPSYVAFTDDSGILVGELAKNYIMTKPENVVYDSKRLIGKTFDDKSVQGDMKNWPFKITNINNKPNIKLMYQNKHVEYEPKYISAQILLKLKQVALRYLNCQPTEILNAVITVPAYFNQLQRKETIEAAKIAGIEVLQLLNEPTAASIAYGFDKIFETEKIILCFDFGGGTLDVSIVSIKNGNFTVMATSGDTHLGGQDIDNALCNYVIRLMNEKYNIDVETLENKDEVKFLIKDSCEIAKRRLTTNDSASIQGRKLCKNPNGTEFNLNEKIEKSKFESIVSSILDQTLESIEVALGLANLERNKIEEIVMVGGSSKIPYVKSLLETFFGKKVKTDVDTDLAIVYGAAIFASKFNTTNSFVNLSINEILPLSVGVKIRHDEFYTIISRGTKIPCTNTKHFLNTYDNQEAITFEIYEGERTKASDNNYLGDIRVKIDPAPRNQNKVFITLKIDKSGMMTIEAKYKNMIKLLKLEINYNVGKISKMLNDAEIFKKTDLLIREACVVKEKLEFYSDEMKIKAISFKANNETEKQKISELIEYLDKIYKWCVQDPICEKEKYEKELITCKSKCSFLSDLVYK